MFDDTDKIVARAKELVPDCDWITDMYVMRLFWVSERLLAYTGYSSDELIGKFVLDLIQTDKNMTQLKLEFVERMQKGQGIQTYVIKGKAKDLLIEFEYLFFDFEGGKYTSVKLLSVDGKQII